MVFIQKLPKKAYILYAYKPYLMRPMAGVFIVLALLLSFIPLNNEIMGLSGSYAAALQIVFGIGWAGGILITLVSMVKDAYK
jgi:hypothetical protein